MFFILDSCLCRVQFKQLRVARVFTCPQYTLSQRTLITHQHYNLSIFALIITIPPSNVGNTLLTESFQHGKVINKLSVQAPTHSVPFFYFSSTLQPLPVDHRGYTQNGRHITVERSGVLHTKEPSPTLIGRQTCPRKKKLKKNPRHPRKTSYTFPAHTHAWIQLNLPAGIMASLSKTNCTLIKPAPPTSPPPICKTPHFVTFHPIFGHPCLQILMTIITQIKQITTYQIL